MRRRDWLLGLLALLGAVLFVFSPASFTLAYPMVGSTPDAFGTVWIWDWVRYELLAGRWPRTSDQMYAPAGVDFLVRNGMNVVDAVVAIPFEVIFGVYRGQFLAQVLILATNFAAFVPLARWLAPDRPSAVWCGTLVWTLNPFVLAELGGGRPTQAMLCFVPLALLALLRLDGWRDALMLGVMAGLQGLTYWYLPIFFALGAFPIAVERLWREPGALRYLAAAVAVAVVIVAPLAVPIALAQGEGAVLGLEKAVTESESWVQARMNSSRTFGQLALVSVTAPLLALLLRVRRAPGMAVGGLLLFAFALGARFFVYDAEFSNVPYIWLYEHSDFVRRLNFPGRSAAVLYGLTSVAVVLVLRANPVTFLPYLLVVMLGLETKSRGLVPTHVFTIPPLPASLIIRDDPGPVLSVPIGASDMLMAQQLHFRAPMVSGMGDHVDTIRGESYAEFLKNGWFRELVQVSDDPEEWSAADRAAALRELRWVWFDRSLLARGRNSHLTSAIEVRLFVLLGEPLYADQYTVLWDTRRLGERATAEELERARSAEAAMVEEHAKLATGAEWPWGWMYQAQLEIDPAVLGAQVEPGSLPEAGAPAVPSEQGEGTEGAPAAP